MLVDFRVIWTPVIGVEGELADHLTTPASLMKYFAVIFFKKLAIPGPPSVYVRLFKQTLQCLWCRYSNPRVSSYNRPGLCRCLESAQTCWKKKQLSRTTWQRLRGFWEAETKIFLCSFDQNILKKSLIKVLISSPERNDQKQFVFCSTQILLFCLTNRIKICSFIFKVISTKDGDKVLLKNFCSKQNLPIISMLVKRWKLTTMIFGRIK